LENDNGEAQMKLWQLVSVMGNNTQLIQTAVSHRADWQFIVEWLTQYPVLVDTQDRVRLDYELPDEFVRVVLARSDLKCYLSNDGWLRSWKMSSDDKVVTAFDAFIRYGGHALEEACEKGSIEVKGSE
jgi:hypothetical protein